MAIEKDNPTGIEEDIKVEEIKEQPEGLPPEVMVEGEEVQEEQITPEQEFASNLADNMDERILAQIGSDLTAEYKKDKTSRKDWEDAYIQGLDLLGTKYKEQTKPFRGASGVTHPLLAESITQFQASAYKELLPSDGPVRTQLIWIKCYFIYRYQDLHLKKYITMK